MEYTKKEAADTVLTHFLNARKNRCTLALDSANTQRNITYMNIPTQSQTVIR